LRGVRQAGGGVWFHIETREGQPFDKLRVFGVGETRIPNPVQAELVEALPFLYQSDMAFWAYMLHCKGGSFYVGHTDDLDLRIAQHKSGHFPGYTRDHLPVEIVWAADFPTREEAKASEKQIKGWGRAKKMALIRGDWDAISVLARGRTGNGHFAKKASPSTGSG
jgi:putative endonuclease